MKIHAGGTENGPNVSTIITSKGPPVIDYPNSSCVSRQKSSNLVQTASRLLYGIFQTIQHSYRRLPLATQKSIYSLISLYPGIYIFLTVPFRISFFYDPSGNIGNQWTEELTIFTLLDVIADIIGLLEFIQQYRFKKKAVERLGLRVSQIENILPTDTTEKHSKRPQRADRNWTLAFIEQSASRQEKVDSDSNLQYNNTHVSNFKIVIEVAALLPVEVIPYGTRAYNTLHLVRITKLCRLYRLKPSVDQLVNIYSDRAWVQFLSSVGIKSLVRNIGVYVGVCHYVACGYMLIAHTQCGISFQGCEASMDTSWVVRDRLVGATVARKYSRTVYWATRTILLLGFDDVAPVSSADTIFVIFVTILGALFVSSLLASFLFIFRFWNARDAAFAAHVDNAREYMKSHNFSRSLRRQVIEYFNYSWTAHHSLDSEEALQLMPKHLQLKVISSLKASRIKQVCFLVKESVEFVNMLAVSLTRQVYSPSDTIIEPMLSAQMFFVIRGVVILSTVDGRNSKECQTGEFFAESTLLLPEMFDEKAVAKTFSELYVLSKIKFDEAMAEFYRETEVDVRNRMIDTLEKYLTQVRKTKKLLGVRRQVGSDERNALGKDSFDVHVKASRRRTNWRWPGSTFHVYWDVVRLLAIFYVAFEVPYFAVFISLAEEQHMLVDQLTFNFRYALMLAVEVLFGVNILLRSRYLARLDHVVMLVVEDPALIFEMYKADGFYLDLIAWLPVGLVMETLAAMSRQNYTMNFRFLRLLRLREAPSLLGDVCDYYSVSSKSQLVISLLLGVIFMLHIVGCVWFEMAWVPSAGSFGHSDKTILWNLTRSDCLEHATRFANCSWVTFDCYSHIGEVYPAESASSTYQAAFAYLRSIYWAIVTLTTVGYGDITAYSTGESFFAAFWIFVGGIINFAIVGAMSSTISNAMAPHYHHMEKLNTVNSTLEHLGISDVLSAEIRRFYHLIYIGRKQAYESQLLSNLPDQLCYEISSLLHSEAVKRVELFDSATIDFLREVTGKFRHQIYQIGDTICLEGDVCREFFIFLRGSKINVFFRSRKVPVRALQDGDCYGVNEFLLKCAHPATLIAASLVQASIMTRDQFDSIQRKFDDDLRDIKAEAQILLADEHKSMRQIMNNLKKLKLQPHFISTPTLFYHGDSSVNANDTYAKRNLLTTVWNSVISFWNFYNAGFVIFRLCFNSRLSFSSSTSIVIWIADLSCDICFVMDIYLRLYYIGMPEVGIDNLIERKEINKQYRRSSTLKWNLLASFPLYAPVGSGSMTASLCRLPRLIRSVDLWNYLDDIIVQAQQYYASHNISAYLSPVKLIIILVLVAHHVGCIFFWISERECGHVKRCWIDYDKVLYQHDYSVSMLYAKSFYWAITTLLLAGSREIVPRSTTGTLWTGFTCLCCTFIIGHVVGEISDLIQELSKETKQYKSRIANFAKFAKQHDLPDALIKRVEFFFHEQFKHTKVGDLTETVNDLSANLQLKLMLEVYGRSISRLPIERFLTPTQINNLALRLKSEFFIPGDNILVEGTLGNRLCMIRTGLAAVFWTSSVTSVAVLMENAVFGELAFFLPGQKRLATVRATTSCDVLYVRKNDWEELWTINGDLSDEQAQTESQQGILDWVLKRLQRYQRFSLHTASKTKRLLTTRGHIASTISAATGTVKAKRKLSAVLLNHCDISTPPIPLLSLPTTIQAIPMFPVETKECAGISDIKLLEKKAEYLQTKSNECLKKFRQLNLHTHRPSSVVVLTQIFRDNVSNFSPGFSGFNHSMGDDTMAQTFHRSIVDIHAIEYMIAINPINRHVRNCLTNEQLCELEVECWSRFKLLVMAEFDFKQLLEGNASRDVPLTHSLATTPQEVRQVKKKSARKKLKTRSFRYNEHANRKENLQKLVTVTPNVRGTRFTAPDPGKNRNMLSIQADSQNRTKKSLQPSRQMPQADRRVYRRRANSLPHFGNSFFEEMRRGNLNHLVINDTPTGLAFGILQRFQHPKHQTKVDFFRWFRTHTYTPKVAPRDYHIRDDHHINKTNPRFAAGLILPIQQTTYKSSRRFISKDVKKKIGTGWNLIMLLVALYHLLVTTFKVCFSTDLVSLPDEILREWAAFEIFLDVLCVFDMGKKLRRQNISSSLRSDMFAMLPLELLLYVAQLRLPLASQGAVNGSWWATRFLLRANRILLIRRIEPLFENLLQHIIDHQKVHLNEAMLYFVQGLATYLTMGHLLACIWFFSSKLGHLYHEVNESTETASTSSVVTESLVTKYLNSLLFAMECISTLFYGDILSMNLVEAVTEIGITFWSIYIYGALVGAQGEYFETRSRREATFEQTLGQLQRYLMQNDVPKEIQHQVKGFYARLWHRKKGEAEFAAVETVPRALYEDVVLSISCRFAVQVRVFEKLNAQFLRGLLVCLQCVVCSKNEDIFVVGDMDRCMYFIAQGRVVVKLGSSESSRVRGDFFGEMALLYGISRSETCVAVTMTELFRLDHEPYERLLLDFPEYRSRNKLAWVTFSSSSVLKATDRLDPMTSDPKLIAETIDAQVPHSYIFRSTMEMLSRLSKIDPQEAKELFLRSRDAARRQLKRVMAVDTSRTRSVENAVHSFRSRSPSPTPLEDETEKSRNTSEQVEFMEELFMETDQKEKNYDKDAKARFSHHSSSR